ncbi:MAG: short-chain fatty acids transporter [Flavobacteriales bacterium]|jgi:short subunit fatty acids transporter
MGGLMVWHGGISGSSLIKVAEPAPLSGLLEEILPIESVVAFPNSIGIGETVFSPMSLTLIYACAAHSLLGWQTSSSEH